jgi:hypothetical protein
MLYASNTNRAVNLAATHLVTINTTTGAVTDIGALPDNIDAIAFAPVPAPGALLIAMMGTIPGASLLLRRRRRR